MAIINIIIFQTEMAFPINVTDLSTLTPRELIKELTKIGSQLYEFRGLDFHIYNSQYKNFEEHELNYSFERLGFHDGDAVVVDFTVHNISQYEPEDRRELWHGLDDDYNGIVSKANQSDDWPASHDVDNNKYPCFPILSPEMENLFEQIDTSKEIYDQFETKTKNLEIRFDMVLSLLSKNEKESNQIDYWLEHLQQAKRTFLYEYEAKRNHILEEQNAIYNQLNQLRDDMEQLDFDKPIYVFHSIINIWKAKEEKLLEERQMQENRLHILNDDLKTLEKRIQEDLLHYEIRQNHLKGWLKFNTNIREQLLTHKNKIRKELSDANNQMCMLLQQEDMKPDIVYSSIFAPAEVKKGSRMMVQIFLHLLENEQMVFSLAKETHKNAKRRYFTPLPKLKIDDKVDVNIKIYGDTQLMMSDRKTIVWIDKFNRCNFAYFVPKDVETNELYCLIQLTVNNVPICEMSFITNIVEMPLKKHAKVLSHIYKKIFISYAHQDISSVKFLAEGFKIMNVDHFFDQRSLTPGDCFPKEIQKYIDKADLFILCWTENAAKSEYVQKERKQALKRALKATPKKSDNGLRIYPMSFNPKADLPDDMRDIFHFEFFS